jgi:RPA family protein
MEGAVRIFAGEFNRSTLSVPAPDGRDLQYVVTPGGAWCHLMYICGVLTEVSGSAEMIHCRVADPTGAFDLFFGTGRPELANAVRNIAIPSFVAADGRAQMYRRNGAFSLSMRPDSVQIVDRIVRDLCILRTADQTLQRLECISDAVLGQPVNERIRTAVDHYRTTRDQILDLAGMVESALGSIRAQPESLQVPVNPRGIIAAILKEKQASRGVPVEEVIALAVQHGVPAEAAKSAIGELIRDDECYQPQKGTIRLL